MTFTDDLQGLSRAEQIARVQAVAREHGDDPDDAAAAEAVSLYLAASAAPGQRRADLAYQVTFDKLPGRLRRRTPPQLTTSAAVDDGGGDGLAEAVREHILRHRRRDVLPLRVVVFPDEMFGIVQRAGDTGPVSLWAFRITEEAAR